MVVCVYVGLCGYDAFLLSRFITGIQDMALFCYIMWKSEIGPPNEIKVSNFKAAKVFFIS